MEAPVNISPLIVFDAKVTFAPYATSTYPPFSLISVAVPPLEMYIKPPELTVVLVAPPPLDAEKYFAWVSRGLNAEAILSFLGDVQHIARWQAGYAAAVREVAKRTGSRLLDLGDAFLGMGCISDYYCLDGIHPNAQGHRALADLAEQRLSVML